VAFVFDKVAKTYFYPLAGEIGIVPKHIWSTGDPAAHPDTWGRHQAGRQAARC